jgi:hypothetical protein
MKFQFTSQLLGAQSFVPKCCSYRDVINTSLEVVYVTAVEFKKNSEYEQEISSVYGNLLWYKLCLIMYVYVHVYKKHTGRVLRSTGTFICNL